MTTNPTQDPKDSQKSRTDKPRSNPAHRSESLDHPLKRHFPAPSEKQWTLEMVERMLGFNSRAGCIRIGNAHNDEIAEIRNHAEKLAEALGWMIRDSAHWKNIEIAKDALAEWQKETK